MSEGTLTRPASANETTVAPQDRIIVKLASPPRHESTSEAFFFWVALGALVEKTQIVRTESILADEKVQFYGLVREVYRQSRQSDMSEEFDRYDGDLGYKPPFDSAGFTYAAVTILRTDPPLLTPPREGSPIFLGGEPEARMAYGADEIKNPLALGIIRNGGQNFAGPGRIDLDYLLGANGGHLNVNGVAGRGTKSSLLLHVNYLLLQEAERQRHERQSDPHHLRIVPIILNVKNFDLFHIDRPSKCYDPARHADDWRALGIDQPKPFSGVTYLAPQERGMDVPVHTGRPRADVQPYSWSLADVIKDGLFIYLFAEEDAHDAGFGALALDIENWLTEEQVERDAERTRRFRNIQVRTFDDLLQWIQEQTHRDRPELSNHH
jgi:hypothetical protein